MNRLQHKDAPIRRQTWKSQACETVNSEDILDPLVGGRPDREKPVCMNLVRDRMVEITETERSLRQDGCRQPEYFDDLTECAMADRGKLCRHGMAVEQG